MIVLQTKSKLSERFQTTIPATIRKVLGLTRSDDVGYVVDHAGQVTLVNRSAPAAQEEDPALAPFLALIEKDLAQTPSKIVPYTETSAAIDRAFVERRRKARGD